MIGITTIRAATLLFVGPIVGHAQVIEISDSGVSQTYDRPTLFAASGTIPIGVEPSARRRAGTATLIADAARVHGLDQGLLEALAWQESRGRIDAVSPKGARGVMQLMPGTAAELGVRTDDVAENIRGGALYLRRQLDRFAGNVPLALAAYNAGPGAVLRYGGVPPYRETRDYVVRILNRWRPARAAPIPTPPPSEVSQP